MSYKEFVRDKYRYCEICPWWKGHVRDDFIHARAIVAPLGFNIIYGIIYELWLVVRSFRLASRRFAEQQIKNRMK